MNRQTRNLTVAAALAAALSSPVAPAQGIIEEIVVTAQKREQSLQEVPLAVSAFSAELLQRSGVNDIRDLMSVSPSLVFTSTASEASGAVARIRGVGTTGDNAGLESSVAVFIDGVYRNRNSVALGDLGKIQRIEVLRGPQGTLFGKNASAGLIHIITQGPEYETGGYVDISGGNFDHIRAAAGITAPLIDQQLAFRLDANWTQRDGFIDDAVTGDDYNDRDRVLVRGQLLWEPTDAFSARMIADWSDRSESCCAAVTLIEGPTSAIINALGGSVVSPPDPYARRTTANPERGYLQDVEEYGFSAELTFDREQYAITSITAYRDWDLDRSHDIDYTNVDILYREAGGGFLQSFETFTQELRIAGTTDRVDWMIGAFYADETLKLQDAIRAGTHFELYANALLGAGGLSMPMFTGMPLGTNFAPGDGAVRDAFKQDAESWAIFTHNTARLTDRLDLTVGIRYTEESKRFNADLDARNLACGPAVANAPAVFTGIVTNLVGAGVPLDVAQQQATTALTQGLGLICLPFFNPLVDGVYSGKRTDKEWTGTISLSYALTDNINAYISAGRGYKAGGFNLDRAGLSNPIPGLLGLAPLVPPSVDDLEFGAETVDSYELGLKSQLFNNLLTLNVAAFYSEFEDFQLNTFTGINFIVSNVDKAITRGVEVEFSAMPVDILTLSGGVTWADSRYGASVISPPGSPVPLAGRRLTNAPEWAASLAATIEQPLAGNLVALVHVDMRYTGNLNTGSDLLPEKAQGSTTVWNGRIGIGAENRRWQLELWARNLFDKEYQQVTFNAPLQAGSFNTFLAEPRTWGGTLRFNF